MTKLMDIARACYNSASMRPRPEPRNDVGAFIGQAAIVGASMRPRPEPRNDYRDPFGAVAESAMLQ